MELTYRMTFGEIIEVILYKLPRTFGFIFSMGGVAGIMLSQFLRMSASSFSLQEKIFRLAIILVPVSLIPIVFGGVVLAVLQHKSQHNFLQTNHDRKLSLSEVGLTNAIAAKPTEIKWAEITNVNQNRKYIFMHLSESLAFAVPKRAFDNSNDAKNFHNYAYQTWKSAKKA